MASPLTALLALLTLPPALCEDIFFVRPDPSHITYYTPDWARRPEVETTRYDDGLDDGDWMWDGIIEVDPAFDLELQVSHSGDPRNMVKTMVSGSLVPTKAAERMERTAAVYDTEDPLLVGLGLDELYSEETGRGRGWGGGLGGRNHW